MNKQRKPLSTKKPPVPSQDYSVIKEWMENQIMPGIKPLIKEIDSLIHDSIPDLQYAIKWGSAFYGTKESGWLIEVAAYAVSTNVVFLNGAAFDTSPPLGTGDTKYIKLRSISELDESQTIDFIRQAHEHDGWI